MKYILQTKSEQYNAAAQAPRVIHTLVAVAQADGTAQPNLGVASITLPKALDIPAGAIVELTVSQLPAVPAAPAS